MGSGDDCQIVKTVKLSSLKAKMIVKVPSLKAEMIVKFPSLKAEMIVKLSKQSNCQVWKQGWLSNCQVWKQRWLSNCQVWKQRWLSNCQNSLIVKFESREDCQIARWSTKPQTGAVVRSTLVQTTSRWRRNLFINSKHFLKVKWLKIIDVYKSRSGETFICHSYLLWHNMNKRHWSWSFYRLCVSLREKAFRLEILSYLQSQHFYGLLKCLMCKGRCSRWESKNSWCLIHL